MSQEKKSDADMRVDEKDSRKTTKLGESHSKVEDGREDYKIETHYASMHIYEEVSTGIEKREVEVSVGETEQEHINAQALHFEYGWCR